MSLVRSQGANPATDLSLSWKKERDVVVVGGGGSRERERPSGYASAHRRLAAASPEIKQSELVREVFCVRLWKEASRRVI